MEHLRIHLTEIIADGLMGMEGFNVSVDWTLHIRENVSVLTIHVK